MQEEIVAAESRDEGSESAGTAGRSSRRRRARYAKAAAMDEQPRVTDLVPQRKLTLAALFLTGVAIVAGLEWLYASMPGMVSVAKEAAQDERLKTADGHAAVFNPDLDGTVAAFDLDGEGSLAACFSSAVLALAGFAALLIYSLRRHRFGDYRGRYRVWLWAAMCWFVMAVDESGSLHEGFKNLMVLWTRRPLYGDGSLWWVIAYGSVLGLLGLLLLWEMRECRFSTSAMCACAALYGLAVVAQLGLILPERGAVAVMLEEGCEMLGNLTLLLAMATHARYLIRDIQGLTGQKSKSKPRKSSKPAAKRPAKAAGKTVAEVPSKPPTAAAEARPDAAETAAPTGSRKLNKAERKAARKRGK